MARELSIKWEEEILEGELITVLAPMNEETWADFWAHINKFAFILPPEIAHIYGEGTGCPPYQQALLRT